MRIIDWSSDVCSSDLLAVWHGFTQPLLMSVIALVSGAAGYLLFRDRLNRAVGAPFIRWLKGRRTFEAVLAAIISGSQALERLFGTRRLQTQLRLLVAIACLAAVPDRKSTRLNSSH